MRFFIKTYNGLTVYLSKAAAGRAYLVARGVGVRLHHDHTHQLDGSRDD